MKKGGSHEQVQGRLGQQEGHFVRRPAQESRQGDQKREVSASVRMGVGIPGF